MADTNNIDIKFKTSADTKGAAETEKAIEGVNDAAKKLDGIGSDLGQVKNLQIAQTLSTFANGLTGVISLLGDLKAATVTSDKELSKTFDTAAKSVTTLQGALQGAAYGAAIGGPAGALLGAVGGGGISLVTREFTAAFDSWKKLQDSIALNNRLPQIFEAAKRAMDMKSAKESWEQLTTEINAATRAAQNAAKIGEEMRKAKVEVAELKVKAAELTGGDVNKAKAEAVMIKFEADKESIQAAVAAADQALQEALDKRDAIAIRLGAAQDAAKPAADGKTSPELLKAQQAAAAEATKLAEEFKQATEAVRIAKENVETADQQAEVRGGSLDNRNQFDQAQQSDDAELSTIQQTVDQFGGVNEQTKAIAEQLSAIAADGKLTAAEHAKVAGLMQQMITALNGTGQRQFDLMAKMVELTNDHGDRIKTLEGTLKGQ